MHFSGNKKKKSSEMVWSLFKLFAIFKMLFPLRQKTSPTLVFQPTATVNSLEHPHTRSTSTGLITESFSQSDFQISLDGKIKNRSWFKVLKISRRFCRSQVRLDHEMSAVTETRCWIYLPGTGCWGFPVFWCTNSPWYCSEEPTPANQACFFICIP